MLLIIEKGKVFEYREEYHFFFTSQIAELFHLEGTSLFAPHSPNY